MADEQSGWHSEPMRPDVKEPSSGLAPPRTFFRQFGLEGLVDEEVHEGSQGPGGPVGAGLLKNLFREGAGKVGAQMGQGVPERAGQLQLAGTGKQGLPKCFLGSKMPQHIRHIHQIAQGPSDFTVLKQMGRTVQQHIGRTEDVQRRIVQRLGLSQEFFRIGM